MDNIDLFDKYIKGELSEKERHEFATRLKDEKRFADDFKVYSATVIGICKEAEQNNKDFEMALKNISKKQLCEIIGKNEGNRTVSSQATAKVVKTIKPNFLRTWMLQAACWAIIIGGSAIWIVLSEQNARYSVDNAIFACAEIDMDLARSGGETIELSNLSVKDVKSKIPIIESIYHESKTDDEIADNGFVLSMAYLKIHDRDKAINILRELIAKFSSNENYEGYVKKWQTILNQLK